MEEKIPIRKIEHDGVIYIGVAVPYQQEYMDKIRQVPGRQWSKQNRCWLVPYSAEVYRELKRQFGTLLQTIEGADTGLHQLSLAKLPFLRPKILLTDRHPDYGDLYARFRFRT